MPDCRRWWAGPAHKIGVTQAAVEAFTIAQSSVIPSVMSQTNRDETEVLNDTNFMGINTPESPQRDTEYSRRTLAAQFERRLDLFRRAERVDRRIGRSSAHRADGRVAGRAGGGGRSRRASGSAERHERRDAGFEVRPPRPRGRRRSAPADAGNQLSSLYAAADVDGVRHDPTAEGGVQGADGSGSKASAACRKGCMQSMAGMFSAAGAPNAASAVHRRTRAGRRRCRGWRRGRGCRRRGRGIGGFPGAALTSYTRPTSSFEPETGGRPISLRAGVLNAADVRGPTASTGMGGTPMPMSPAGMLARGTGAESDKDAVTRARVVIGGDPTDPQDA